MKKFYFTFMQSQYALKDYYIVIEAQTEDIARAIMVDHFGQKWASSYKHGNFHPFYFPKGQLLKIKQR